MRTRAFELSIILLAVLALSPTVVFAADMFSGTWTLNAAKTTAPHFTTPVIEKIEADDNGIKVVAVNSVGAAHVEYAVKFDGKDYPYTAAADGKPNLDGPYTTYSARKIDDYTIEFTIKVRDLAVTRILGREIMSISKDGRTRTVTQFRSAEPQVIIWDKQ